MSMPRRELFLAVFVAAGFLVLAQTAAHAEPAASFALPDLSAKGVRSMAATCAPCHNTGGSNGGGIPVLAGGKKEYFVRQMVAFRDGKREATVMQQLAKGYSDAEYAALGEYFAAQVK